MAYITKAKAQGLLYNVRKGDIEGLDSSDLYKVSLDNILAPNERFWLAKAREIFRNFDVFIDEIYIANKTKEDSFTLVYEGGSPCFHYDIACGVMHSDYNNATIPDEIIKRGKVAVIKFRHWFAENEQLRKANGVQFIARMKTNFNLPDPNLKFFEAPNSGIEDFNNENLESIENKIDSIINATYDFFDVLYERQKIIILQYGHRGDVILPCNSDNKLLLIWHRFKSDLKNMMLIYFRVKFNPDLNFSLTLLEQLGFRQCQKCAPEKICDDDLPF